jgi:hypothetical protein
MDPGADVRSLAALRDWQGDLLVYKHEAEETLAGIALELRRATEWVREQESLWKRAVRECEEEVVQAKAELAARKFPGWDGRMPDTTVQEKNLRRAQARLEHATEKAAACRAWQGKLPKLIEETYSGAARRLNLMLEGEVSRAAADLERRIAALEAYADLRPDFAPAPNASLPG